MPGGGCLPGEKIYLGGGSADNNDNDDMTTINAKLVVVAGNSE